MTIDLPPDIQRRGWQELDPSLFLAKAAASRPPARHRRAVWTTDERRYGFDVERLAVQALTTSDPIFLQEPSPTAASRPQANHSRYGHSFRVYRWSATCVTGTSVTRASFPAKPGRPGSGDSPGRVGPSRCVAQKVTLVCLVHVTVPMLQSVYVYVPRPASGVRAAQVSRPDDLSTNGAEACARCRRKRRNLIENPRPGRSGARSNGARVSKSGSST